MSEMRQDALCGPAGRTSADAEIGAVFNKDKSQNCRIVAFALVQLGE